MTFGKLYPIPILVSSNKRKGGSEKNKLSHEWVNLFDPGGIFKERECDPVNNCILICLSFNAVQPAVEKRD